MKKQDQDLIPADSKSFSSPIVLITQSISEILSILIFLSGCLVLVGWAFDITMVMKINTAVCFVLMGTAIYLSQIKRMESQWASYISMGCAWVMLGIGLVALILNFGRMSLNGTINFILIAIVLLLLREKKKIYSDISQCLLLIVGLNSLSSLISYAYGDPSLYIGRGVSTPMALQTTVLFVLSCVSILFCRPAAAFMAHFTTTLAGGKILRRLLPVAVITPIVFGFMEIYANKMHWLSTESGIALIAVGNLSIIGAYICFSSVLLNRSDYKRSRMEKNLVDSQTYLNNIINTVADPIFVKDHHHRWVLLNNAFSSLVGHSVADLLGKSDGDIFSKEEADIAWKSDKEVLENGGEQVNEGFFTDARGKRKFITIKKTIYVDSLGNKFIVGIIDDTTESKLIKEALEKANDELELRVAKRTEELTKSEARLQAALTARSQFLAQMSHELRTPLNAINGFSEVLYDESFGPLNPKQKKYVHNTLVSGKHLLELINDTLDIAKVEAGKMELFLVPLSINKLIQNTVGLIQEMAHKKGIKISTELSPGIEDIEIDERKIKEVVFNFLSNAIKYTPAGGRIGVKTWKTDTEIGVEVWDTGIGIAPENFERVFEAFTRIIHTQSFVSEGTGLGLTLCKKLIELHKGRIWLESGGYNKGTQVRFTLPMHQVEGGV